MDTSTLDKAKTAAVKAVMQLSMRERILAVVAVLVVITMVTYSMVIAPSIQAFATQRVNLKDLETIYDVAPDILGRYAKLVSRRREIEGFYEKVDLKSDPLSYLERLLKESAQIPAGGYSVTPRDGVQLGERYLHKIYTVKFEIADWKNLLRFLKDLTSGSQPMLLSQINLDKRQTSDSLNVQLEVSGFAAISGERG
jgi:hypothetical protein